MVNISPRLVIITSNYAFEKLYRFGINKELVDDISNDKLFLAIRRRMVEFEITEELDIE